MAFSARALRASFCALVALLAVFQFSENTADPDLWGHIVYGRQILREHSIPRRELYSWTARGQPWINHEWLAEVFIGGAHRLAGGSGVLLLKVLVGLLTFALCLRMGGKGVLTWAVGAVAVVEISYGFAARPQIFTALFLVIELMLLRCLYQGKQRLAFAIPILFAAWVNMHGGVLAGLGLLGLSITLMTVQSLRRRILRQMMPTLWLSLAAAAFAMLCNPWGFELIRWLVGSVLWLRPEIQEWRATPLGWDHAAFFLLLALTLFAWLGTRRPRAWWEIGACAAFGIMGVATTRNAPLFAIVALALIPPHLADALERYCDHWSGLIALFDSPFRQKMGATLCSFGTIAVAAGTFLLHKQHPLTMAVPKNEYPVTAMDFIRDHRMTGKLLVFFDWGEEAIFRLPGCPVSIDGRLDTCYSRELIAEQWKFYNGQVFDGKKYPFYEANLALLPVNLAGTAELAQQPGWKVVYYDGLAAVLAHDPAQFAGLKTLKLPVEGPLAATQGRAPFPDHILTLAN